MKYAKVQKDRNSWIVLVAFDNKDDREEQRLRFFYEFPDGSFEPMGYYEARKEFDIRKPSLEIEMCAGRTYKATPGAKEYRAMRAAEIAERLKNYEKDLKHYERDMDAETIAIRWPE